MVKIKESLLTIDYKLFGTLILLGLLPTIYTTVRIIFIGDMPGDWGFNIASQLAWVNVLYEVIQEALILPMFYFMGKSLSSDKEFHNKIRTGLIFTVFIYSVMFVIMMVYTRPMLLFMAQQTELLDATVQYIRLESVSLIFSTAVKFLLLVLIIMKKEAYLFWVLGTQMILSIIFDTFLVSSLPFSAQLGVNGIAITNIFVNIILLSVMAAAFRKERIYLLGKDIKLSFKWLKEWFRIGGLSGLESFVRNAAFILMILRLVNVVKEQGTFWVTNNFIWGWLLLPVLQLGELIKRDSAVSVTKYKERIRGYFALTGFIVILWFISIPFWGSFIQKVMGIDNFRPVLDLSFISIGFYVVFAFNNIIDSVFYGRGRTDLMLYQSLIVNIIFYGTLFILYSTGIFLPTLTGIAVMFGTGILFDSIITFIMFYFFMKKQNRIAA
ncbi:MAG: multidrug transporter [Spirochaetes bacterium]|nr:multidrug transporter [Spirochaetota bacterium]